MPDDSTVKTMLLEKLRSDPAIGFKKSGNYLRNGKCPNCGKRELVCKVSDPWRVWCNRPNACGYTAKTRELYGEVFANLSKKYRPSAEDPNATADAYMTIVRGFERSVVGDMYMQGTRWLGEKGRNGGTPTVRVPLPLAGPTNYWERLIDADGIQKNGGKKAHIRGDYRSAGWVPPGMTFEEGDRVWITEGIFKSMAFLHHGMKSITGLSSSNLPRKVIKEHAGKGITWVIALDNDKAGAMYTPKYIREIKAMGEESLGAFPEKGEDWDDVHRKQRLDGEYLQESFWRGRCILAKMARERAYFLYLNRKSLYRVFDHGTSLWRYKVDAKKAEAALEAMGVKGLVPPVEDWSDTEELGQFFPTFTGFSQLERISNCLPEFMYIEKDALTDEQWYSFRFSFASGNPPMQVSFEGGALESPTSFNKALLSKLPGGTFDGIAKDLKQLRDGWFNDRISYVKTTPFCGYDRDSSTYIFPGFGYHKGEFIKENNDGYLVAGKQRLKCGLRGIGVKSVTDFTGEWIDDYQLAFGMNGMVLLAWWVGSLFAEQIRAKQESWPFLEYTGDQGSGKSTQITFLWRCLGREHYEGVDPSKSTAAGRARTFQQVANLPVVLLEGDRNSEMGSKRGIFDFDELKTAYNGKSIRAMGVKKRGAETEEPPFRGSILISQNAQVDGSDALLARIIYCNCTRAHFTPETELAARRLAGMGTDQLAGFLDRVLRLTPKLLGEYFRLHDRVKEDYEGNTQKVQNRLLFNHAQIAAWGWLLPVIFDGRVSEEACMGLQDYLWNRCLERNQRIKADHPLVDQFWDIVKYLNFGRARNPDGTPVHMLNHSINPSEIAISLPHLRELSRTYNQDLLPERELKRLLPTSRRHKFIRQASVRSRILDGKVLHCWVFEASEEKSEC